MPELPEVETVVRSLQPDLVGCTILEAWMDWEGSLKMPPRAEFLGRIQNQTIIGVRRRAKYIVIQLSHDWLLIHLKMTGRLYVVPDEDTYESDRWVHFRFQLDNGHQLRFSDARKFGTVHLTDDLEAVLGHLGPEPLEDDFTLAVFRNRLQRRNGMLKPLLLNQTVIAGLGNIYVDEALHRACLHPRRRRDSLSEADIIALYEAIRWALKRGIERQGASIGWYRTPKGNKGQMQDDFQAYGQTGKPCPRCGTQIQKITVAQRGTHFCPICQPIQEVIP